MFETDITSLDVDATLSFAAQARALSERAEVRVLEAAAHYGDLHAVLDYPAHAGRSLPGTERLVLLGGEGTPEVAEFAAAELGAVLAISPHAAAELIGAALDLRHRLPRLWARVLAGEVKAWVARNTARATRHLPVEVAAVVDARISPWAYSRSWTQLETRWGTWPR